MSFELIFESFIPGVSKAQVWKQVTSWDGINYELLPFLKMTKPSNLPSSLEKFSPEILPKTSLILLFGLVPIDIHTFIKFDINPVEFYFVEQSWNIPTSIWKHRRKLSEDGGGVVVKDHLEITPRTLLLVFLLKPIYSMVFRRRHERLKFHFLRNQ